MTSDAPVGVDRTTEFAVMFRWFWYQGFPVSVGRAAALLEANRATWTQHFGHVVSRCAESMGLFVRAEKSARSDAVLLDADNELIAVLEWEWDASWRHELEQLQKFALASPGPEFCVLYYYASADDADPCLDECRRAWAYSAPLLHVAVVHDGGTGRRFRWMRLHRIKKRKIEFLYDVAALPWEHKGSRWHVRSADPVDA